MAEPINAALCLRRLEVGLARTDGDVEGALRLRYRVFAEEEKNLQLYNPDGLETDRYDEFCDHLVVKDLEAGEIIGTYRLLPGPRAAAHIGFYSESEFDLEGYRPWVRETLELGRSCITRITAAAELSAFCGRESFNTPTTAASPAWSAAPASIPAAAAKCWKPTLCLEAKG
ncbi:GNAT family N-acetyltransferase [Paenibacillus sp. YN15]|uniref:GNAT family N-acetyltransferase n=1 Tax=Paenibacillus sp. YN15 TaxID=1742774 RepID=UPI00215BFF17|nr:GNAT family N-acetyltransferase [Paenibacillus sp. YN15]